MKKIIIPSLLLLLTLSSVSDVFAKKLNAIFSYATFYTHNDGPYIETYLLVDGKSVQYTANTQGKFQGVIEVTMIFKRNDSIINFKKYELLSPETQDTSIIDFNFLDLQRILLPNGSYDLELTIVDKNTVTEPFNHLEKFSIAFDNSKIEISEIQLTEQPTKTQNTNILTKAGYDIIPYIINYYPKTAEKMNFYAEIYNTSAIMGDNEPYVVSYYIESWETQQALNKFNRIKRETAKPTNVIIGEFSIKELPSGNYNLVIVVRDKNNEQRAIQKFFFYRSNPDLAYKPVDDASIDISLTFAGAYKNLDTLTDLVMSLYPISTELERVYADNNLRRKDIESLQKFFYNFWITRNPSNPEAEWRKYVSEVQKVNKQYSTGNRRGYETDRGRVYLQYGPPNSITASEHEPSAYPYEIWHYYKLNNQSNRRFVFYSREFATNDYELIHSDALGEINDPRWQVKIHKRDTPSHSLDPEDAQRHWGGRVDDYYKNPR